VLGGSHRGIVATGQVGDFQLAIAELGTKRFQ
jgi:hypothetical protein